MFRTHRQSHRLGQRMRAGLILAAAVTPLGIGGLASAATRSWNINSGNWNVAGNWLPNANVPLAGEDVLIVENDGTNRVVTLNVTTPSLLTLKIDNTGAGSNTLSITGAFQ